MLLNGSRTLDFHHSEAMTSSYVTSSQVRHRGAYNVLKADTPYAAYYPDYHVRGDGDFPLDLDTSGKGRQALIGLVRDERFRSSDQRQGKIATTDSSSVNGWLPNAGKREYVPRPARETMSLKPHVGSGGHFNVKQESLARHQMANNEFIYSNGQAAFQRDSNNSRYHSHVVKADSNGSPHVQQAQAAFVAYEPSPRELSLSPPSQCQPTNADLGVDRMSTAGRRDSMSSTDSCSVGSTNGCEDYASTAYNGNDDHPQRDGNNSSCGGNNNNNATSNRSLPPCRICGAKASGFHYGVNSCEACKGFFRRALKRPIYFYCTKNKTCDIKGNRRSTCRFCRYKRCLRLGMSREAIKTGRYSHKKRTSDIIEVKQLQNAPGGMLMDEPDFDEVVNSLVEAHEAQTSLATCKESESEFLRFKLRKNHRGHLREHELKNDIREGSVNASFPSTNTDTNTNTATQLRHRGAPASKLDVQHHSIPSSSTFEHATTTLISAAKRSFISDDVCLDVGMSSSSSCERLASPSSSSSSSNDSGFNDDRVSTTSSEDIEKIGNRSTPSDCETILDLSCKRKAVSTDSRANKRERGMDNGAAGCVPFGNPSGYPGSEKRPKLEGPETDIGIDVSCPPLTSADTTSARRLSVVAERRDTETDVRSSVKVGDGKACEKRSLSCSNGSGDRNRGISRHSIGIDEGRLKLEANDSEDAISDCGDVMASKVDKPEEEEEEESRVEQQARVSSENKHIPRPASNSGVQRAEDWVKGFITFANSIPGFDDLPAETKGVLLRQAWDEVWMLQAFSGYNRDLGVVVLPSGACFSLEEMCQGWGSDLTRIAFDLASVLNRCHMSLEVLVLLKAVSIVSPDRCPTSSREKAEQIQWFLVTCLLNHLEQTRSQETVTFPKVVSVLTALRDLSESAQSNRDRGQLDQCFGGALFPGCFKRD